MLATLKFVQGAIAKKDFVPALTHFHIQDGVIRGYNGRIALSSPIDLDLNATPKALPFAKAIQACGEDATQLHMTPAGKLAIKSGKFKAFIECTTAEYPNLTPEGEEVAVAKGFLDAMRVVAPFMAEDASRPWAQGVLFKDASVFATNNIIIIEKWIGEIFPFALNIPKAAVTELLRIGIEPERLQFTEKSLTFHFPGGRWMRCQSGDLGWPDLSLVLDRPHAPAPFPDNFFEALAGLLPFLDEQRRIHLLPGALQTSREEGVGASIDMEIGWDCCLNGDMLMMLEGVAESIDLSAAPRASTFLGDNLRGAIVGMRS